MKQVKLFAQIDDFDVALVFTWNDTEDAWVCMMEDSFMQELGPLPMEKNT